MESSGTIAAPGWCPWPGRQWQNHGGDSISRPSSRRRNPCANPPPARAAAAKHWRVWDPPMPPASLRACAGARCTCDCAPVRHRSFATDLERLCVSKLLLPSGSSARRQPCFQRRRHRLPRKAKRTVGTPRECHRQSLKSWLYPLSECVRADRTLPRKYYRHLRLPSAN